MRARMTTTYPEITEYQKKELELQQKLEEKDNKIKQLSYREKKVL